MLAGAATYYFTFAIATMCDEQSVKYVNTEPRWCAMRARISKLIQDSIQKAMRMYL